MITITEMLVMAALLHTVTCPHDTIGSSLLKTNVMMEII